MSSGRGISLWKDPFTTADKSLALNLSEHDKNLLSRLQQGERSGLNLERIHGANKHVLVIRTNKKRRLFLWVKGHQIVVIHIMNNHKYDRVPARVMEFIFRQAVVAGEEQKITYQKLDQVDGLKPDQAFQLDRIEEATCYNQDLIVYDENQRAVLAEKLPVFLHGDFGSGKSAIARSLLIEHIIKFHETDPTKDFVYYSHLPGLVAHMRDMFLLDNPELPAIVDMERIKFLDTLSFVREYAPKALTDNKQPVGMYEFQAFITKQYQSEVQKLKPKQKSFISGISVNADIDVLYDELQLIASCANDQSYLSLGVGASNVADPEARQWLLKVAQLYFKHLNDHQAFDPALLIWEPKLKPIALFVGDEMQGAPRTVVKMIPKLVMHDNVLLCCDSNQSERRLSVIPYIKEAFAKQNMPLTVRVTPGSYRSPAHIMPLINAVIRMKQYINGGLNDSHQSSVVESKSATTVERGSLHWVDVSALNGLKAKLAENNTVFVVITPEERVQEAKHVFGEDVLVYTPSQARGMEFPVVVQYKIMDKPMPVAKKGAKPRLLSELINPLIAEMPLTLEPAKHQPKAGKANPIYEAELNAWVIAFSRLVGDAHCFVVEASNKSSKLHKYIKAAIMQGQALMKDSDQTLAAGTRDEWEALAQQNMEAGHREQALVAYRRLGKTEEDLDRDIAMHEKNKQDRLDKAMKLAEERKEKIRQEEASKLKPSLAALPTGAPSDDELTISSVSLESTLDIILEKIEMSVQLLHEAEDIPKALRLLIESNQMNEAWYTPIGPDEKIYFLSLIAKTEVATAFFELIAGENNLKYMPFAINLFKRIDWLSPYTQRDVSYTRLHWMMSDSTRAYIFRSIWLQTQTISSDADKVYDSFPLMATPHFIPEQDTEMTLIALMATKHMKFFRSFIKVMTQQPLLGDDIAKGLLLPFTYNGIETNAIEWISKQSSPELVEGLVEVMMLNLGELAESLASKSTAKEYGLPHQKAALQFCSALIAEHLTKKIIAENSGDLFTVLLRMPNPSRCLMHQFPDGETFITKVMANEAFRDRFLNRLCVLIENAEADDDPDKGMACMLNDIKMNVRFDLNAKVMEDEAEMPLLSALERHRKKLILIQFFKGIHPEAFNHGGKNEAAKVELNLKNSQAKAIEIFEDFKVVEAKFKASENKLEAWKKYINDLPIEFWTLNTQEDPRPFILRLIADEAVAKALFALMLKATDDLKLFMTTVFENIDWLTPYDSRDENVTRLHWMMESQVGALIFKRAREWMGDVPYSEFGEVVQITSLVVGYKSEKVNATLPLIAMLFMKHPDILENFYRSHPSRVGQLAQGLLEFFEFKNQRMNVIGWLAHSEGTKSFEFMNKLLKIKKSLLLTELAAIKNLNPDLDDDYIISLDLCLSFERVYQAEKIIRTKDKALMQAMVCTPKLSDTLNGMVRFNKSFIDCLMEDEALRESFFDAFSMLNEKAKVDDRAKVEVNCVANDVDFQFNDLVSYGKSKIPLIIAIYLSPVSRPLLALFEGENSIEFYSQYITKEALFDSYEIVQSNERLSLAYLFSQECTERFTAILSHPEINELKPEYWLRSWKSKTHGSASILMIWMKHFDQASAELSSIKLSVINAALSCLLKLNDGGLLTSYIEAYFVSEEAHLNGMPKINNPTTLFHLCAYFASVLGSPMCEVVKRHAETILEALELRDLFRNLFSRPNAPRVLQKMIKNEHWYPALLSKLASITEKTDEDGFCLDQCRIALTVKNTSESALNSGEWSALACLSKTKAGVDFFAKLMRALPRLLEKLQPNNFYHPTHDANHEVIISLLNLAAPEDIKFFEETNLDLMRYIKYIKDRFMIVSETVDHVVALEIDEPSDLQVLGLFASGGGSRSSSPPIEEEHLGCKPSCQI